MSNLRYHRLNLLLGQALKKKDFFLFSSSASFIRNWLERSLLGR